MINTNYVIRVNGFEVIQQGTSFADALCKFANALIEEDFFYPDMLKDNCTIKNMIQHINDLLAIRSNEFNNANNYRITTIFPMDAYVEMKKYAEKIKMPTFKEFLMDLASTDTALLDYKFANEGITVTCHSEFSFGQVFHIFYIRRPLKDDVEMGAFAANRDNPNLYKDFEEWYSIVSTEIVNAIFDIISSQDYNIK